MATNGPIVVIGSINMDLVCRVVRMPRPGETIGGDKFITVPGGKGANQAVAAAKLANAGHNVHMVGRVGEDDFGERLVNGLTNHGVNTDHVTVTERIATGTAMILVDHHGENSIVVAAGANSELSPRDIVAAEELIRSASVVLLQLEIPLNTVQKAIRICADAGVFTVLDPTPVPAESLLPRAMYAVDIFSPNQREAELLLDIEPKPHTKRKIHADAKQIAADLLARGPKTVVLKLGPKGSLLAAADDGFEMAEPYKVKVVDTTAAGDAFAGALAVAQAEQMTRADSLRFANAAGALACTAFGAQPSLPSREAVDKLVSRSMHRG